MTESLIQQIKEGNVAIRDKDGTIYLTPKGVQEAVKSWLNRKK